MIACINPTSADAGELNLGLVTLDVDVVEAMDWSSLAFGTAYRANNYEIEPGELVPYADYDTINGVSIGPLDATDSIFFI